MKKVFALTLALAMTLSLAACGSSSQSSNSAASQGSQSASSASSSASGSTLTKPVNMTLLSQGPGSDDYITLATEGKMFQANLPAGSTVTQETISSGCSSVGYLIEAGMGDFGTGQNAMSGTVGMEGKEPYSKISALIATTKYAFVAELATQSYVDKTGNATIADVIANKAACRFVAEPVGSSDYVSFMYLLDIHDVTVDDIKSWGGSVTFTDGSACCDMLQDGQADMMVGHTVSTSSSLTELCMSADMVVSGLTEEEVAGMCERGYAETVIPTDSFGITTEEMPSACQASAKIVSSDMSDELAYALTKILVENREALGADLAGYRNITFKDMVDTDAMVVPMHPGAIKYFQDIGVLDANGNYIGEAK
ncbi:MAG: TAXI family TRAP transporter solute-binding subunit [Lawsonibacter sp.]